MNSHINESHVCLVKNWTTFRKMQIGAAEIEKYLVEVAREVIRDILRQHGSWLEENEDVNRKFEKDHWFALRAKNLVNFKGQGVELFCHRTPKNSVTPNF